MMNSKSQTKIPRVPQLDGLPWHITSTPELGELAYEENNHESVDHAIWQAADGKWQVWSCIRGTKIGRLFYGWEGDDIEQPNWKPVGVTMRVDRSYGESINDWFGEEWIQAPHVIRHNGLFYMFYGGHNTELGESQICLATSKDGRNFSRYKDRKGYSRLFVGPGGARDPMILRIGDKWACYYCANDTGKRIPNKDFARTSDDLIHWSDYKEVAWGGVSSGTHAVSAECPFVIFLDGYYYLFRTSEYYPPARTHVYRSEDPFDFGLNTDEKWVATLRVSAPEVVQVGNQYYISSVEDLKGGIQLFRLKWV
jgi:hypothetical protein